MEKDATAFAGGVVVRMSGRVMFLENHNIPAGHHIIIKVNLQSRSIGTDFLDSPLTDHFHAIANIEGDAIEGQQDYEKRMFVYAISNEIDVDASGQTKSKQQWYFEIEAVIRDSTKPIELFFDVNTNEWLDLLACNFEDGANGNSTAHVIDMDYLKR
ncbi:MAG TPA: hypothetical protein ENK70_02095 [Methylophaga sp.]|nr:hypothetical protein [Methylophaga sp.]